jgi:hypothetical protein
MGGELAHEFSFIEFFPINGAGHVSVLTRGTTKLSTG